VRRIKWLALFVVILLLVPAVVAAQSNADSVTIDLQELNDSGVSGTATLTAMDGQTQVVVSLEGDDLSIARPNHIHTGTCDNLGGVEYPLTDVMDEATTMVNVDLATLLQGEYAVNVHKSADEIGTYIACGNIEGEMMAMAEEQPATTAEEQPATLPQTGGSSLAWLVLVVLALGLFAASVAARRTAA
jgi:LPXTG-motif cell wall-anchored protein